MASRTFLSCSIPMVRRAVAVVASLVGWGAVAHAGIYNSAAALQANSRGDLFVQPFAGAVNTNYPQPSFGANGFNCVVAVIGANGHLRRDSHGIGTQSTTDQGLIGSVNSAKPPTAFGGTFTLEDASGNPIAGSMQITTDTGFAITISVPATGTFFGFTTSQPFTTVGFNAVNAGANEMVDNVYIGTAIALTAAADQCGDAPTLLGASVQLPFDTTTATAEAVPGSCSLSDSGPDVWVRWVAPSTGSVTMSTCGCTFDSILRVFSSCGGTQLACNDDACPTNYNNGFASSVTFRTVAGTAYLARVSGYVGGNHEAGTGVLSIAATADCRADFNHDAATNVQDIFDFLSAWFAGCP